MTDIVSFRPSFGRVHHAGSGRGTSTWRPLKAIQFPRARKGSPLANTELATSRPSRFTRGNLIIFVRPARARSGLEELRPEHEPTKSAWHPQISAQSWTERTRPTAQ